MEINRGGTMADAEKAKEAGYQRGRWWEAYGVRYALGTVFGTAALYILLRQFAQGEMEEMRKQFGDFKPSELSFWTAMVVAGLGYCYVCSAPISVFHASRGTRSGRAGEISTWMWLAFAGLFAAAAVVVFVLPNAHWGRIALYVLALPALYVLWDQYRCIWTVRKDIDQQKGEFVKFYRRLSGARASCSASTDIRDSYTDLREHANSVFILLLEVSVFCLLWIFFERVTELHTRLALVALFLMVWLIPNRLLWGIANDLEKDFSMDPAQYACAAGVKRSGSASS
jgi:hypothetical protein